MKITIEHEAFTASTTSLIVAERLLETIRVLENKPKPQQEMPLGEPPVISAPKPDIFDTDDTEDIPEEILKPSLPPFKPAWLEKHIDFNKSKIVRYSNPCSTLHGECGGKCYQTELWIETNGNLDTCDCEFYELDELKKVLDAYIKHKKPEETNTKPKSRCSMNKLKEVADLFNRGCDNKQVAEILKLSLTSVSAYKSDCKKCGLLTKDTR